MAQRTTVGKVRNILVSGKDYDGSTNLQPFIDTATLIVDRVSTLDTGSVLSSSVLERMEAWIAAHLYCTPDRPYQSRGMGRTSSGFQGQTGMHLDSTYYGQNALLLDFNGDLKRLSEGRKKATAAWLGLPPSEQTDYVDRD